MPLGQYQMLEAADGRASPDSASVPRAVCLQAGAAASDKINGRGLMSPYQMIGSAYHKLSQLLIISWKCGAGTHARSTRLLSENSI